MPTIIIEGKTYSVSEEKLNKIKESLAEGPVELTYPDECYVINDAYIEKVTFGIVEPDLVKFGACRITEENAKSSFLRMTRTNRLEAFVEQLQGDLGGEHFIYQDAEGVWRANVITNDEFSPEAVTMGVDTAKRICDLLNSKEISLNAFDPDDLITT